MEKAENDDKLSDEKTTDKKDNNKEITDEKKSNEEVKTDDTASKKAFRQYGSTPIITSLIIITSILGCLGYKKFKKTIIK